MTTKTGGFFTTEKALAIVAKYKRWLFEDECELRPSDHEIAQAAMLLSARTEELQADRERLKAEIEELKCRATEHMDAKSLEHPAFGQYVIGLESRYAALRKAVVRFQQDAIRYISKTLSDEHNPVWDSDEALSAVLRQSELRPVRETFDPEAVRALLGCIESTDMHGWWNRESTYADLLELAEAVAKSERK